MRTFTAAWLAAISDAGARPVWLMTVYAGLPSGASQTLANQPGLGYPASIADVSSIASEIDPLTRAYRLGEISVTLRNDPVVRALVVSSRPYRIADLSLGTEAGGFERIGRFLIKGHTKDDGGALICTLVEPLALLRDKELTRGWALKHPLTIIRDIFAIANLTDWVDLASIDPTAHDATSHWVISRVINTADIPHVNVDSAMKSPGKAFDLIAELLELINCTLVPDENGIYSLLRYDPASGIQRTFTIRDVGTVREVHDGTQNLINSQGVSFGRGAYYPGVTHTRSDASSVAAQAVTGYNDGVRAGPILDTPWLNGVMLCGDFPHDLAGETIGTTLIIGYVWAGLCTDGNSTTRPTYLRVETLADPATYEIIRVGTGAAYGGVQDLITEAAPALYYRSGIVYIFERGCFGTSSTAIDIFGATDYECRVSDVTIPIALTNARVERFSNGAPVLELTTSLRHIDLDVGDFVALVDDSPVWFGHDGSGASDTWEIVRKELRVLDDSPGIVWTLCFVPPAFTGTVEDSETSVWPVVPTTIVINIDGATVESSAGETVYR